MSNKNCHFTINKPKLIQLPKVTTALVLLISISINRYKVSTIATIKDNRFKPLINERLTKRPNTTTDKKPNKGKNKRVNNILKLFY